MPNATAHATASITFTTLPPAITTPVIGTTAITTVSATNAFTVAISLTSGIGASTSASAARAGAAAITAATHALSSPASTVTTLARITKYSMPTIPRIIAAAPAAHHRTAQPPQRVDEQRVLTHSLPARHVHRWQHTERGRCAQLLPLTAQPAGRMAVGHAPGRLGGE